MASRARGITGLVRVIDFLRDVQADMQLQTIRVFLEVAISGQNGILQAEIMENLKMPQSSVSRNCKLLTSYAALDADGKRVDRGHDLVSCIPDALERRKLRCFLTPKGEKLFGDIENIMEG